ncbi:MAG: mftE [Frankiales bacterium]|nr:mftE [Frankiales bacterium]
MSGPSGGHWLTDLTWPETDALAAGGAFLAVPLGSTEQHGPHLPLSTDTDIALALCARLAAGRPDAVIAPPVPYGSSGEHAGFAGTLSIGQGALELLLVELCRSATDTFGQILLVSAHGGNSEAVTRAVRQLRSESRDVSVFTPRWSGDPHAGRPETALQLASRPDRVHSDRAVAGDQRPLPEILPLLRAGGVRAVSPSGILGDPRGATAAEGARLLDELAAALLAHVAAWRSSGDQ